MTRYADADLCHAGTVSTIHAVILVVGKIPCHLQHPGQFDLAR